MAMHGVKFIGRLPACGAFGAESSWVDWFAEGLTGGKWETISNLPVTAEGVIAWSR